MDIDRLQADMQALGFYDGVVDGIWGPRSEQAYDELIATAAGTLPRDPFEDIQMAWGKKVNLEFKRKVKRICEDLEIEDPDWLMACMAFETGETFSPSVENAAGSGATGLIQFMPATARGLGTTTDHLARMTAVEQLDWVKRYFEPYRGRLHNMADVYMAILWPAGIGKLSSWALWDARTRPTTYHQNRGLDVNRDKTITRGEAVAKVEGKLRRGRKLFYG